MSRRDLLAVRRRVVGATSGDALVLVACSGGPDSLGLAAGAALAGRPVGAVVVDHGLQAGSRRVADEAAAQCRSIGLAPVHVVSVAVTGPGGPEAAAREARYRALRDVAAAEGATGILLAHTLDDQAETVLLRLARGSGARSLSGMTARDGDLVRPLLDMRRAEVHAACETAGLHPVEDPHNRDPRYLRSRLRHHSLPALVEDLGDGVVLGLARSAAALRADNEALDEWAATVLAQADDPAAVSTLAEVPSAVRIRVIRALALRHGAIASALSSGHLLAVDGLVTRYRGQGPVDLPGNLTVTRVSGSLEFQSSRE